MSESLVATLDRVVEALDGAGVPYALCGGLAVNCTGTCARRATSTS